MDNDTVTVVSGLPRSGTSMLMKMLEEGGLEALTDNKRTADIDNPKGYYEFERVLKMPTDVGWLPEAKGKVVKVLAELTKHLPAGYDYKIIFITRNMSEMLASQKKMLVRRGMDPDAIPDSEMKALFERSVRYLKKWMESQENIDVLYVNYNEILETPEENINRIHAFMEGRIDKDKMSAVVDARLYRNRT